MCLLIAQVFFFMLFIVFVVISCELDTLNLYWYGLEVQKIKSCLMTYKLSLEAQFEIKGLKKGPYVMVQKYINLVKNKPMNLDPKGLSKIKLKKKNFYAKSQIQPKLKPKPAKLTNLTRLTDDPNHRVWPIYRVGCGLQFW